MMRPVFGFASPKIFRIADRPTQRVDCDAMEAFDDPIGGMIVSGLTSLGLAILSRSSATERRVPTRIEHGPEIAKGSGRDLGNRYLVTGDAIAAI